jgi:hypothetical protein
MSKTISYEKKPARTVTDSRFTEEQLREIDHIRPPDRVEPVQPGPGIQWREDRHQTATGPVRRVEGAIGLAWPPEPERLSIVGTARDVPDDPAALAPYADSGVSPNLGAAKAYIKPAQPAPGTTAAKIAWLKKKGITLVPTIDGEFETLSTKEKGAADEDIRKRIEAARPLLRAYVHGTPLRCATSRHSGGPPPEAVTLTLGGAAACADCMAGKA